MNKCFNLIQYKKAWDKETALRELRRWCAVQERSHEEVRLKLIEHRIFGDALEEILAALIADDFLNETRFAMAYVSGKFKINDWGKNKILAGLKLKKISPYNIKKAMASIDDDMYRATIKKLIAKKSKTIGLQSPEGRKKVLAYLLQKGFESEWVYPMLQMED